MLQPSQQIKIIQLLPVPHDIPLNLAGVHPRHEILHVAGNQVRRISNDFSADADVTLFDEGGCLQEESQYTKKGKPRESESQKKKKKKWEEEEEEKHTA